MNEKNREAVILLGHGSRVPGAGEGMERIAARMRERLDGAIVEISYMSKQGPSFAEALERCVARGAEKVIVIPYFLHAGLHIREDIPSILEEKAKEFPDVEIILGKNLGFDECLVDLVLKRLDESRTLAGVGGTKPAQKRTGK